MTAKHFLITNKDGAKRLIQAKTKGAALAYAIGTEYTCVPAKTNDVIDVLANGGHVEFASAPSAPAPAAPVENEETNPA